MKPDRTTSTATTLAGASIGLISRRAVLFSGAAAGGGLLLGFRLPGLFSDADAAETDMFAPNAFIRIDREGLVTRIVPYVEMGQGTYTAIPMLIAEELEVPLDRVRVEHAPAGRKNYGNPVFGGEQMTGGSTSIRAAWQPMRRAGATAREMLVAAAARRWKVEPTACRAKLGKVLHTATGRTFEYGALLKDAARLPVPEKVELKRPEEFILIGTSARRLDTPSKVNGAAIYGIDARPPGVKLATLAQCPVFGGKLKAINEQAAMSVKGVRQVVRLDDAVAVVADHMGAAKKGLAALSAQWDYGQNAGLGMQDVIGELDKATLGDGAVAQSIGDTAKALSTAAQRVDAIYQVPFLAHATMEPMNCTVHVRADGCEVWVGTQVLARAQDAVAKVTGLPVDKVVVHNHLIGGGFGRRLEVDGVVRAVQIAAHVEGPVKIVWSREEDIQHDMYRPYWFDRLSAGLDAQGAPIAWSHRFAGSSILARFLPPAFKDGLDGDSTDGAIDLVYDFPNVRTEYVRREPPGIPTAFWRSVGPSHNVYVVESFLDELAVAAKKDPIEYRRGLLGKSPRARAVLDLAAQKSGWGGTLPPRSGRGVSLQNVFGTYMAQVAEVEVDDSGRVRVRRVTCALDCGAVVNPDTIEAQIEGAVIFGMSAALHGKIVMKAGRIEQSNFHDYRVVRMSEVPAIETHIIRSGEAPGGMGEPGTCAVIPAITNAIFAATGQRVRRLPVEPADLKHS